MLIFILEIKLCFGYIKMVMLFYCIVILVIFYMFFSDIQNIFGSIGLNGLVYSKNRTEFVNILVTTDVTGSEPDPTGTEP